MECNLCKHEFEYKETHGRGDRYYYEDGGRYILATSGNNMAIIVNLSNGNVWTYPIECKNVRHLTDEEWCCVTAGKPEMFEKLR